MTPYKENPNLKFPTVKTVNGETEYRKNCRKIKEKFYVINKDVCKMEDERWYLLNSKKIAIDYETGKRVIIEKTPLVYGIVEVNKSGTPIFGYFTENKYNNVWINVPNYGAVKAFNEEILKESCVENMSEGRWYPKHTLSASNVLKFAKIASKRVYTNKGYNIEDNAAEFKDKIATFDKYPMKLNSKVQQYAKLLGDTTFGCEVETSMGYIPDHLQYRTGTVICRDGSIDNAEFVTVPLKGAKGLMNIKNLCGYLNERTETDIKCSFHIHLGNLPQDRLYITSLYALSIKIQEEVYKMFPYYKTDWKVAKKQDYNQKTRKLGIPILDKKTTKADFEQYVDESYYKIFTFLNDGIPPDDRFNRINNNHHQQHKWNRKQRYHWINFINMFFSPRRTIEFRLHQPTLNAQKMINWLFICNAIARYAEHNAKKILSTAENIKFDDVLDYYGDHFKTKEAKFLSSYLKAYVVERKAYFAADYKKGDYVSEKELAQDKKYSFTYEGVTELF